MSDPVQTLISNHRTAAAHAAAAERILARSPGDPNVESFLCDARSGEAEAWAVLIATARLLMPPALVAVLRYAAELRFRDPNGRDHSLARLSELTLLAVAAYDLDAPEHERVADNDDGGAHPA